MSTHIFYWLSIWLRQWSLSPGVEVEICPTFVATSRGTSRQPDCLLPAHWLCIPKSPWPTNYAKYLLITFLPLSLLSFSLSHSIYIDICINWPVLLEKGLANAENACHSHSYEQLYRLLPTLAPSLSPSFSPSIPLWNSSSGRAQHLVVIFAACHLNVCQRHMTMGQYGNGKWQLSLILNISKDIGKIHKIAFLTRTHKEREKLSSNFN